MSNQGTVTEQLKGLLFANFFLAIAFGISLQELLGLINSLQIVAHLPLNNVPLPANCYFMFDILVKIVTFDLFPMHQYYDFNFTSTEAWSNSFAWLDYDSLNFVENMGSVTLLFGLTLILALIAFFVWLAERIFRFTCGFRGTSHERSETQQKIETLLSTDKKLQEQVDEESKANFEISVQGSSKSLLKECKSAQISDNEVP